MADETRGIHVIMGPYRDSRLTVSAADAEAAINAHWAVDPHGEYPGHEPLTDQQRTDAMAAAHAWAQTQWDAAQGTTPPEPPPPEGGEARKKTMKPEESPDYKTRQAEPKR